MLLDLVDDAPSARVNADVRERGREVGHVRPDGLAAPDLARDHVAREQELLRDGQDQGAQRCDVGFQGLTCVDMEWGEGDGSKQDGGRKRTMRMC